MKKFSTSCEQTIISYPKNRAQVQKLVLPKRYFFFTRFSLRVAGAAAPDQVATPLDQPTQTAFRSEEVPNGSNQDPRYN